MRQALLDYLNAQTGALTLQDILLCFAVALLLGSIIYISYRFSFSGAVYSARFNASLIMLTLVTALVMSVIGNNIALSLGMVGALSIVRFRTAIKDPRDTVYIFWCIAVGICCGVSEFLIAGIGTITIFLFLIMFGAVKRNDRFLLIVRGTKESDQEIETKIDQYFDNNAQVKVMNTTPQGVEYIFAISEKLIADARKKNENSISAVLYTLEGVSAVNMVSQNDEINR